MLFLKLQNYYRFINNLLISEKYLWWLNLMLNKMLILNTETWIFWAIMNIFDCIHINGSILIYYFAYRWNSNIVKLRDLIYFWISFILLKYSFFFEAQYTFKSILFKSFLFLKIMYWDFDGKRLWSIIKIYNINMLWI